MKYKIFTNLLGFKNSRMENGNIIIPIADNNLYVHTLPERPDTVLSVTSSLVAWEMKDGAKYGNTHLLKQDLPKEQRDMMTPEQIQHLPVFGRMRPFEPKHEEIVR